MNYNRHKYKEDNRFSYIKQPLFFILASKRVQIAKKNRQSHGLSCKSRR